MKQPIIAPSILTADLKHLGEILPALEKGGAEWIHLDIMDGNFVPPLSFGPSLVKWTKDGCGMFRDVHLMVARPDKQMDDFINAGAEQISFHVEAEVDHTALAQEIRKRGIKAGIAINPPTPLDSITGLLDQVDLVVVMGVNPGWGGQKLIAEQLGKLKSLAEMFQGQSNAPKLQLDGGVTLENAKDCWEAGADVLVAGSCLVGADDKSQYPSIIQKLVAAAA